MGRRNEETEGEKWRKGKRQRESHYLLNKHRKKDQKAHISVFPDCPVAETVLPMQGAWVRSLIGELDPICCN